MKKTKAQTSRVETDFGVPMMPQARALIEKHLSSDFHEKAGGSPGSMAEILAFQREPTVDEIIKHQLDNIRGWSGDAAETYAVRDVFCSIRIIEMLLDAQNEKKQAA